MTDENDLGQALNDVRKAYRLIWLYQTRIKGTVRIIRDQFGHNFYYWDTRVGKPGTTDPITNSAWSMLPFYRIHLLHLPSGAPNRLKACEWMFEIYVEADDGFQSEPIPPTEFKAPERSNSVLYMCGWYCTQTADLNWYNDIWKKIDWPDGHEQGVVVEHANPSSEVDMERI